MSFPVLLQPDDDEADDDDVDDDDDDDDDADDDYDSEERQRMRELISNKLKKLKEKEAETGDEERGKKSSRRYDSIQTLPGSLWGFR